MISAILFLSFGAFGKNCAPQITLTEEKKIQSPKDVNYFIRSSPATGEIGYSTGRNANIILDTKTGESYPVTGIYDPVLSADGNILSAPGRLVSTAGKGMTFSIRDKNDPKKFSVIFEDEKADEYYQSLGVLSKGKENIYRLFWEGGDTLKMKDYRLDEKGNFSAASGVKDVCSTAAGIKNTLPSLSKDGKEFISYDPVRQVTVVTRIEDCKTTNLIDHLVGKGDFSPNGKLIAYHIDKTGATNRAFFTSPSSDSDLSVYIFDRESATEVPVKSDPTAELYYPVFMSDDELAYVEQEKGTGKFYIVVSKINIDRPKDCSKASNATWPNAPEQGTH